MLTEKRLSREEEERLIAWSIVPLVPLLIFFIAYIAHLKSVGVIASFSEAFQYVLLAGALFLTVSAGIYEVASSFKVKKPLEFRIKRFLSRTLVASLCVLCFYAFWTFFTLFLSSVLRVEYILLLSLLSMSFALAILVRNPRTGRYIKKLTMEE